ncbi:hypothetical protein [Pseudomonas syringae]|nr:hypothetical protein [Pseudomonas syringae]EGH71514.1 hypothetical protein PSYAR_13244 [Pseudomonas syringae pv. aceris str. M302273]KOG03515.1 Uncharacterized protein ABJ98_2353 [Pseudomonas syringae pv. aceris]
MSNEFNDRFHRHGLDKFPEAETDMLRAQVKAMDDASKRLRTAFSLDAEPSNIFKAIPAAGDTQ